MHNTAMAVAHPVSPSRRRQVYSVTWKFEIGAAVAFGDLSGIVLDRSRSVMGREMYSVWITGEAHGRPYRVVAGGALAT